MAKKEPAIPTLGRRAWELLRATLLQFLKTPPDVNAVEMPFLTLVPEEQRTNVIAILEKDTTPTRAYRVALIIQLAYGIATDGPLDLTKRQRGARGPNGVAGQCGTLLRNAHIIASADTFQNIGKNNANLARGNLPAFDRFLKWASEPARTKPELRALLTYACFRIAQTARPVDPLPEIDQSKLTFAVMMTLFEEMLATGSAGAHEQFLVAGLLQAVIEQREGHQRVETKKLNASDQSSGSAADVQLKTGTKVEDAFEVTANQWQEKLEGAVRTIRAHDLSRLHILARITDYDAMLGALRAQIEDISVLELRAFISVLTAELRKQFRANALRRFYELLERYQGNTELVNSYVGRLRKHGFIVGEQSA